MGILPLFEKIERYAGEQKMVLTGRRIAEVFIGFFISKIL